jgi:hypothetical protein
MSAFGPKADIRPMTSRVRMIGTSACHPATRGAFYAILSCEAYGALACENPSELWTMLAIKSW